MKYLLLSIAIFVSAICLAQQKAETQIQAMLQQQSNDWNNGDIDAFMQSYWQSDSLMFIGKSGVTYGWQKTLENYKKGYPDTAAMGKLQFTIIKVEALSPVCYNVIGKWHLTRTMGDLQGHYTLIVKKINGNWFIVQDHSS